MGFHFRGRTLSGTDRLKLAGVSASPATGGGLIGLVRPTSNRAMPGGFYTPGGVGGYLLGRDPLNGSRLSIFRPMRLPAVLATAAASTATITTASFTPPPYCTLIVFSAVRRTATPTASAITDSLGGTWTLIPTLDFSQDDGATVFLRLRAHYLQVGGSPAAMTVSSTSASAVQHGLAVVACEAAGVDWSNVAGASTPTTGAVTVTLGSGPSSNHI